MSGMFRKIKSNVSRILTESEQGDLDAQKQAIDTVNQSGIGHLFLTPQVKITKAILSAALKKNAPDTMTQMYRQIQSNTSNAFYRQWLPKALVWIKRSMMTFDAPTRAEIFKGIIDHEGSTGLNDIPDEILTTLATKQSRAFVEALTSNALDVPTSLMKMAIENDPRVVLMAVRAKQQIDDRLVLQALLANLGMYVPIQKLVNKGEYTWPRIVQRFIDANQDALNTLVTGYRAASGNTEI